MNHGPDFDGRHLAERSAIASKGVKHQALQRVCRFVQMEACEFLRYIVEGTSQERQEWIMSREQAQFLRALRVEEEESSRRHEPGC